MPQTLGLTVSQTKLETMYSSKIVKPKMLLLEDDALLTTIVGVVAKKFIKNFYATASVEKAILMHSEFNPKLVISDYHLGNGKTSLELLHSLKLKNSKVMVYSSDEMALSNLRKTFSGLGWKFLNKNEPQWPVLLQSWLKTYNQVA